MTIFPTSGYLDEIIAANSYLLVGYATSALLILTIVSLKTKKFTAQGKKLMFGAIVSVIIIPTLYLIISTVHLNLISESRGPVHWHADIEVWNCGKELDLKDPHGLSNKIGTATFHEHNDKRLHVEGVVINGRDVNLSRFFDVIGGEFNGRSSIVPTNDGNVSLIGGKACPSGESAEVQVFVYKTDADGYFSQQKIAQPELYQLSPDANVPPGDCIIMEYGPVQDRTDKLCRSYKVAEQIGKLKGERK
jgi:hypothetical protein